MTVTPEIAIIIVAILAMVGQIIVSLIGLRSAADNLNATLAGNRKLNAIEVNVDGNLSKVSEELKAANNNVSLLTSMIKKQNGNGAH